MPAESNNIEIFLRVKPVKSPSRHVSVELGEGKVEFQIPKEVSAGLINNQKEHYDFKFNGIISSEAKQDEVFERIARNSVLSALDGFNSTVFAYGQTGSGKTFTITGGTERYADRGIIPRALSLIYNEISRRTDFSYNVHISYLEIYNDSGYDLLDPAHETTLVEELPKVTIQEREDGQIHCRGLLKHPAATEEDALNLLFLGDTNRNVKATMMNDTSSRSHCIFTVELEARASGSDTVRRSKLNLVDLAGSERVSKTGAEGQILSEAKYINLSLHYLEQVIVALQERAMGKSRPHIPYRNSMMTSILRDSLGGNCRTSMVATMSPAQAQLDESISTCRFAQRVAMVANSVSLNEELDPTLMIRRLKAEVKSLREEVRVLRGEEEVRSSLTADEVDRVRRACEEYVSDPAADRELQLPLSTLHVKAAYEAFRQICLAAGGGGGVGGGGGGGGGDAALVEAQEVIRKLKVQIKQRNHEIEILVNMLDKKEGGTGSFVPPPVSASAGGATLRGQVSPSTAAMPSGGAAAGGWDREAQRSDGLQASGSAASMGAGDGGRPPTAGSRPPPPSSQQVGGADVLTDLDVLADRNKAFETFRRSYRKSEVIEENVALLRDKYAVAKSLGESVNAARDRINQLKAAIERERSQRVAAAVAEGQDPAQQPPGREEMVALQEMEAAKASYKEGFAKLRELKREIEHVQMMIDQSRKKLLADFEQWAAVMVRQRQATEASSAAAAGGGPGIGGAGGGLGSQLGSPQSARGSRPGSAQTRGPPGGFGSGGQRDPALGGQGGLSVTGSRTGPVLTGNPEADADIRAFYEAREKLLRAQQAARGSDG